MRYIKKIRNGITSTKDGYANDRTNKAIACFYPGLTMGRLDGHLSVTDSLSMDLCR
jgi:hypothetical protein